MSIESGPFTFYYVIEGDVCYLTLTDKAYPKKLAFQYLDELQSEFSRLYGPQIEGAVRPYAFIKFGEAAAARVHTLTTQRGWQGAGIGRDGCGSAEALCAQPCCFLHCTAAQVGDYGALPGQRSERGAVHRVSGSKCILRA